jgi:hypothetical protein
MDDRPWEEVDEVDFYPWKGANYDKDESVVGIRALVMGESTYFTLDDPEKVFDHQCSRVHDGEWKA